MATFMTYYETGSLQKDTHRVHKSHFGSKRSAMKKAMNLSRGGRFVSVLRNGIGVAIFHNQRQVDSFGQPMTGKRARRRR